MRHRRRIIVERPGIGRIRLTWADDWARRQTVYHVQAQRVSGAVTVAAEINRYDTDPMDPDTCLVRLVYGVADTTRYGTPAEEAARADPLTINGVTLTGGNMVYPDRLRQQPLTMVNPSTAPNKTRDRAAAVLTAVAGHWVTRDPHYLLFRLATMTDRAPDHAAEMARKVAHQRARLAAVHADYRDAVAAHAAASQWFDLPPAAGGHAAGT